MYEKVEKKVKRGDVGEIKVMISHPSSQIPNCIVVSCFMMELMTEERVLMNEGYKKSIDWVIVHIIKIRQEMSL